MTRSPSTATDGEELTANFTFAIPDKPAVTPVGLDQQLNKLLYSLLKPIQAKDLFKRSAPSIIIVDELDCIFPSLRGHHVALVATTNLMESLDPALLSRLPLKIEVPLPSLDARKAVLLHHIGKTKHTLTPKQIFQLAAHTSGWVPLQSPAPQDQN
ncbi:hypothetical protein A4X06_0g5879 [Tilletia controversa]|uniref:ATPase AAA-type core domain-containing protein n=1 Tax=Tilletia controversa TaxID=13291 RepID=A0A8X7SVV1_9BASI|nr:hypothetical protein A4X06_0g5879 [Tilletia controversa]